jgi:predicted kinase
MRVIARLIHLNGAPGIGKTSLARRYLDDHALALLLDIDAIRTSLGRWSEHAESKLAARDLALAMALAHLRGGHDVVLPQYLGRMEFIVALGDVAERSGAAFIEVLLDADRSVHVERFRSRRNELLDRADPHPQADVLDAAVDSAVSDACANLARVASQRPSVIRIRADDGLDETYAALMAAIDSAVD